MAGVFLMLTGVCVILHFETASYFWYAAFSLNLIYHHDWNRRA